MFQQKILKVSILALAAFAQFSYAQDPFFKPLYFPDSAPPTIRGSEVNQSLRRSLVIQSPEELRQKGYQIKVGPNEVAIGNYFHNGKFYVATMPIKELQDTIFQKVDFTSGGIPAAHSQIRFRFSKPNSVKLYDQANPSDPEVKHTLGDVVVSAEANFSKDKAQSFDLFKGLKNEFHLTIRARSVQDVFEKNVVQESRGIFQYKMALSAEEQEKYFLKLLERADLSSKRFEFYNTLGNSCTTELYDALDTVIRRNGFRALYMRKLDRLPLFARRYLSGRGLLYGELPKLEVEMKDQLDARGITFKQGGCSKVFSKNHEFQSWGTE